jgi:hypothetical protein
MEETINSLEKWELLKVLGGLTVVLSALISFCSILFREWLLGRWRVKQEGELAFLKSQLSHNSQLVNQLTQASSAIFLSSSEQRIKGFTNLWENIVNLKENMPTLVITVYSLLTDDEVRNISNTESVNMQQLISNYSPQEYFSENHRRLLEVQKKRPFIGQELWASYFVYQQFIGRLTHLLRDGLEKGAVTYWMDDKLTMSQILPTVIPKSDLDKLCSNRVLAFQAILNYLETQILNEISEQVTGKRITESTLKHAIELSELTKNTGA